MPECSQKCDDWKMLESGVRAFGWINPLLGQMAPSPAELTNPSQFVTPPAFKCVCVPKCIIPKKRKKKKSSGSQAVAKMVDGTVLVLEYDWSLLTLPFCVSVCARVHTVVCFLNIIHEDMPQFPLGKYGVAG